MTITEAETKIANVIIDASKTLLTAIKYIYYVSFEDFYTINIKDVCKIALIDVTNYEIFNHIGLRLENEKIRELNTEEFLSLESIIRYSFAVRLPFIRRLGERNPLRDSNINNIYGRLQQIGIYNPDDIVDLDYKTSLWMMKTKRQEPIYDVEWFRRWVYTYGGDLAAINNRNLFLMGCIDALLPLCYSAIQDKIAEIIDRIN